MRVRKLVRVGATSLTLFGAALVLASGFRLIPPTVGPMAVGLAAVVLGCLTLLIMLATDS